MFFVVTIRSKLTSHCGIVLVLTMSVTSSGPSWVWPCTTRPRRRSPNRQSCLPACGRTWQYCNPSRITFRSTSPECSTTFYYSRPNTWIVTGNQPSPASTPTGRIFYSVLSFLKESVWTLLWHAGIWRPFCGRSATDTSLTFQPWRRSSICPLRTSSPLMPRSIPTYLVRAACLETVGGSLWIISACLNCVLLIRQKCAPCLSCWVRTGWSSWARASCGTSPPRWPNSRWGSRVSQVIGHSRAMQCRLRVLES